MRVAARLVERMHGRILEVVAPGLRKCDLVAEIYDAGLRYDPEIGAGGDYPAIVPLLPSGADAAAPHLTWDDAPMRAGEGTFFEIAGACHRYHCPLSRTVFLGKPTQTFLDAEAAVLEGMEAGLAAAKRRKPLRGRRPRLLRGPEPPSASSRTTAPATRSASPTRRTGASAPCRCARATARCSSPA